MAIIVRTITNFPLNGSDREFDITFDYLARRFVKVAIIGGETRQELTLGTDYRFVTKTRIRTTVALGSPWERIEIRRETSATDRVVNFSDGSVLRAKDLNASQIQAIHIAEEARDNTALGISQDDLGNLDAKGRPIKNVGEPTSDSDAATKGYVDSATTKAIRLEYDVPPIQGDVAGRVVSFDSSGNPVAVIPAVTSELALAALLKSTNGASEIGMLSGMTVEKAFETLVKVVTSLSALRALPATNTHDYVYVSSYWEGGTSGGGLFVRTATTFLDVDDFGYSIISNGFTWTRLNVESLNFLMYGADPTGTVDSLIQIIRCANAANRLQLPIVQTSGQFRLQGTSNITFKTSCNFRGSKFIPAGWTGSIIITRDAEWVTYSDSSPETLALNSNESKMSGSCVVDGWVVGDLASNAYIRYDVDQDMFKYRSVVQKRSEHNVSFTKGQLASGLYYAIPEGVSITNLRTLQLADNYMVVEGITIDESQSTSVTPIRLIDGTKIKLKDTSFVNRGSYKQLNVTRLRVTRCAYIKLYGVDCTDVNATPDNTFTYSVSLEDSYGVTVLGLRSDGYGWGSTGSNNCQRVTFGVSQLSRIDFHLPCKEYLKVQDCIVGNWGILVTMMGDLECTRVNWQQRNGYNNSGFIRTRSDAGGWADGDLYVTDCKITGYTPTYVNLLHNGFIKCQTDASQGEVPNSPINFTCFRRVVIDKLKYEDSMSASFYLMQSTGSTIFLPTEIVLNDVDLKGRTMVMPFTYFKARQDSLGLPKVGTPCSPIIDINGGSYGTLNFTGSGSKHLPFVTMNNVHNRGENDSSAGVVLEAVFKGRYQINGGQFSRIRTYSGGYPTYPVAITMTGGALGTSTTTPVDSNADQLIHLDGVEVLFPAAQLSVANVNNFILRASFNNCRFYDGITDSPVRRLPLNTDSQSNSATVIIPSNARYRQQLSIITGYDAQGTTMSHKIPLESITSMALRETSSGKLRVVTSASTGSMVTVVITVTPNDPTVTPNADNIRAIYIETN